MNSYISQDIVLKTPFTMAISGSSASGKSTLAKRLLEQQDYVVDKLFDTIVWCYAAEDHKLHSELNENVPYITFVKGWSNECMNGLNGFDASLTNCLVIDDMMRPLGDSETLENIFTTWSHHKNCSVIYINQNFFHPTKVHRTINRNLHYLLLMKSCRDLSAIRILGSQMMPGHSSFVLDAYKQAVKQPHGYLLIDFKPDTLEEFRLRNGIFCGEEPCVFLPETRHPH